MEVGVVGVVAGEVELELAAELPSVLQLGGAHVEAEDRVVHAEHGLVVAVLAAVPARTQPVGVGVDVGLVRVVDRLERDVAVGRKREALCRERLEEVGRGVGQQELLPVPGRPDASGFAHLRVLVLGNLHLVRRGLVREDRACRGLVRKNPALQFGDALRLRFVLGFEPVDALDQGL